METSDQYPRFLGVAVALYRLRDVLPNPEVLDPALAALAPVIEQCREAIPKALTADTIGPAVKAIRDNEILETLNDTADRMRGVLAAKNADYTGSDVNVFKNFELVELVWGYPTEQGICTRLMDKIARIAGIMKKGFAAVAGESMIDAIEDAIGYLVILKSYILYGRPKRNDSKSSTRFF